MRLMINVNLTSLLFLLLLLNAGALDADEDYNVSSTHLYKECLETTSLQYDQNSVAESRGPIVQAKNSIAALQEMEQDHFNGLYLTGEYHYYGDGDYRYLNNVDYEYQAKVRWEIFKDGYFDSQKKLSKSVNKTESDTLRLVAMLDDKSYEKHLFELNLFKNEINLHFYERRLNAYEQLLVRRQVQLREGFITVDDVDSVREEKEKMQIMLEYYKDQDAKKIDSGRFELINTIETLTLKKRKEVEEALSQNHTQLKLLNSLAKADDYGEEYIDNLKVNVYAEYKNVDYVGWITDVGVYADIPIDFDDSDSRLKRLQHNNAALQQQALTQSLSTQVDALYQQINLEKAKLMVEKNSLKYLNKRQAELEIIYANNITGFKENPEREIESLKIKAIDQRYIVIMKRLEIYALLLRLLYITDADNLNDIVQLRSDNG